MSLDIRNAAASHQLGSPDKTPCEHSRRFISCLCRFTKSKITWGNNSATGGRGFRGRQSLVMSAMVNGRFPRYRGWKRTKQVLTFSRMARRPLKLFTRAMPVPGTGCRCLRHSTSSWPYLRATIRRVASVNDMAWRARVFGSHCSN